MATKLPKKLKQDSITEAVFEVRFQSDDPDELILGRLLSIKTWQDWEKIRLPIADFPAPVRAQDKRLKHEALYDIRNKEIGQLIKVGPNVISCHVIGQYPGWLEFSRLISKAVTALFSKGAPIRVSRLGLRYINALTRKKHFISSPYDLAVTITVRNEKPSDHINLNYSVKTKFGMAVLVRVASRSLVSGTIPDDSTAYIDVDVGTTGKLKKHNRKSVMKWVTRAHTFEKEQYFKLLPDEIIEKLRE